MEDTYIMSVGERLRHERKKLRIGQDEIAGDKFSKNYISMFENNRRKINRKNAEYLASKINEISRKKGIESNIRPEYFLKSKIELARDVCTKKIEKLQSDLFEIGKRQEEIHKVLVIARDYSLARELGEIHYIRGLEAYRANRYRCAVINVQKSLNYFNKENELTKSIKAYELLGDICFMREYYEEAIIYYNLGMNMARDEGGSFKISIYPKLSKSYDRYNVCKGKKENKSCV